MKEFFRVECLEVGYLITMTEWQVEKKMFKVVQKACENQDYVQKYFEIWLKYERN